MVRRVAVRTLAHAGSLALLALLAASPAALAQERAAADDGPAEGEGTPAADREADRQALIEVQLETDRKSVV